MDNKLKKKYVNYLILLVIIVIAAIYYFSNNKATFSLRNINFAVENIEDIDQLILNTESGKIELTKQNNDWKVNQQYYAKNRNILNFVTALNRLEILSPVSKTEKAQIASILKSDGIQVEIIKNNKTIRKYYVSKPSMHKSKTYMMMYKSDEPFIIHIPSFKGKVAGLFVLDENYWRDQTVFNYKPQDIKEIKLEYSNNPEKSFRITNFNDGTFSLQSIAENKYLEDFHVEKVATYFVYFQGIEFDQVLSGITKEKTDSILQTTPFITITVEDFNRDKNSISIYRKEAENELDEFGQKAKFDYNKAYARLNNSSEIILIQYHIFDPLLKEIDYFR